MAHVTYRRRKAAGLCTRCGAPKGATQLCEPCRTWMRQRQAMLYERAEARRRQRRAAGQCWHCKEPAVSGRTLCERHLEKARSRYTPNGRRRGHPPGRRRAASC